MDYLVKLYELASNEKAVADLQAQGIVLRHAMSTEKHVIANFVNGAFGPIWASEVEVAFAKQPTACFIAVAESKVIGFCAYDSTCKGFLGPAGVLPAWRKQGIGLALLREGLHGLKQLGYAYAIAGAAREEFPRWFGAIPIPDSTPGWYKGMLRDG